MDMSLAFRSIPEEAFQVPYSGWVWQLIPGHFWPPPFTNFRLDLLSCFFMFQCQTKGTDFINDLMAFLSSFQCTLHSCFRRESELFSRFLQGWREEKMRAPKIREEGCRFTIKLLGEARKGPKRGFRPLQHGDDILPLLKSQIERAIVSESKIWVSLFALWFKHQPRWSDVMQNVTIQAEPNMRNLPVENPSLGSSESSRSNYFCHKRKRKDPATDIGWLSSNESGTLNGWNGTKRESQ